MPSIEELADSYFKSINPLAKKIAHDIDTLQKDHPNWEGLNPEEQEQLIDDFIIQPSEREKFSHIENSEITASFPKLLLKTGEKIVVDLDNDCLTWRDEHSAPFSWETQSQLEFRLSDLDKEIRKVSKKKSKQPQPPGKNSSNYAYKPEKSIWNSPFLMGEKSRDSSFASEENQQDEQVLDDSVESETFETDDVHSRLGLAISLNDSHDGKLIGESSTDETSLLDASKQIQKPSVDTTLKSPFEIWKDFELDAGKTNWCLPKRSRSESEEALLSEFNTASQSQEENLAADNPVDDDMSSAAVLDVNTDFAAAAVSADQIKPEMKSDWAELEKKDDKLSSDMLTSDFSFGDTLKSDQSEDTQGESLTKSGFAFLDNW